MRMKVDTSVSPIASGGSVQLSRYSTFAVAQRLLHLYRRPLKANFRFVEFVGLGSNGGVYARIFEGSLVSFKSKDWTKD